MKSKGIFIASAIAVSLAMGACAQKTPKPGSAYMGKTPPPPPKCVSKKNHSKTCPTHCKTNKCKTNQCKLK